MPSQSCSHSQLLIRAGAKIIVIDRTELSCMQEFTAQSNPLLSVNAFTLALQHKHDQILDLLIRTTSPEDLDRYCTSSDELIDIIFAHADKVQITDQLISQGCNVKNFLFRAASKGDLPYLKWIIERLGYSNRSYNGGYPIFLETLVSASAFAQIKVIEYCLDAFFKNSLFKNGIFESSGMPPYFEGCLQTYMLNVVVI